MNKCPTPESGQAGKAESCKGCPNSSICASSKPDPDIPEIQSNLSKIKLAVAVLSGKGGVGKSTMACNIARRLADCGFRTLILDFDLSGPSVPRLTGTSDEIIRISGDRFDPIRVSENLWAISVGHLEVLEENTGVFNSAAKNFTIKKILKTANFTGIDLMVIDTPPNITDEHLALATYIKSLCGILVTTPQKLAFNDVVRQISFCKKVDMKIIGMVENMKQLVCNKCGHMNAFFNDSGVEEYCKRTGISYLGSIPLNAAVARSSDGGYRVEDPLFDKVAGIILEEPVLKLREI
ncbi:hypothetical protein PAEPH01_0236 [Pancytospora epiphaga]|nr:hypothetical protein PAEPH01_0236 [Pancytospora epiphaga]